MRRRKILILGGTTEASALARRLAPVVSLGALDVTLSLAGVTRSPLAQPVPVRLGGFGGVAGLARHLAEQGVDILVDATHPFAARMSHHARAAAGQAGLPLVTIRRPPWSPQTGDRWTPVATMEDAADALGAAPRRVFLTIGQQELAPFAARPWHHYLIRSVDPPDPALLPPGAALITATGPFAEAGERALLHAHAIEALVTKNSGGSATRAKLDAARGLPVLMVARPDPEPADAVPDADSAEAAIAAHLATLRGV